MIFHYDNTARVFERELPYHATWGDWGHDPKNRKEDRYDTY